MQAAGQLEVDEHALVLGEPASLIIPIAVTAGGGGNRQAGLDEPGKRLPFRLGDMGVVNESGDIPHIGVGGSNIEIAPQHQRLAAWLLRVARLVFHMPGQGIKPPELIVVMPIRYRTSVRNIEGPDSHSAAVRGNGPGLQVLRLPGVFSKTRLVGKGRLDVGKPHSGEDGYPIPLVEAMVRNFVAGERIEWKLFVLTLGFLHQ